MVKSPFTYRSLEFRVSALPMQLQLQPNTLDLWMALGSSWPLAEGDAWMNYGPESKARHLLRAESNAEFLRSLQKEMRNDELVVCVSHGAIMGTTVRNARILRACL